MDEQFGAAISEQGVPLAQASDDQKVIDTRWKTLDILYDYTYSNTVALTMVSHFNTNYIEISTHNLGYLPAFDYEILSYTLTDPSATVAWFAFADNVNVYLVPQIISLQANVSLTVSVAVRVYALNITQFYQAPNVQAISTANPSSTGFGIEFIKPADASPVIINNPINEYSFNTQLHPLNILQNGTYTIPSGGTTILINYTYPQFPLYLLAQYLPSGYVSTHVSVPGPLIGSLGFQGGSTTISSTALTVTGVQSTLSGSYAYILFKDPIGLNQ